MKKRSLLLLLLFYPLISFSQTGPAGVGNSTSNRMWLKADANVYSDAGTTLANESDLIQQWNDQSGNAINAIQTNALNQPIYRANIINGKPALEFTGNSFIDGSSLGIAGSGGFSYVLVLQPTSYEAGNMNNGDGHYILDRTSATDELVSFKVLNPDNYALQKRTDAGLGLTGPVSTSSVNTSSFEVVNFRRIRGTSYDLFLNGTLEASIGDSDGDLTPPNPRIGRHVTSENEGLNGYLAEMMVFNFDLNNAQINIINSYLSAKYNLATANSKYAFGSSFGYDVAGIGREDNMNEHTDAQSARILQVNTASSLSDGDYLLFGHNNEGINTWTSTNVPSDLVNINRLARTWRVDETGDVGTVKLTIDNTLLPTRTASYTTYVLMVDSDGDFTDGASVFELVNSSGSLFESVASIDLTDGDYITIGEVIPTVEFTEITSSGFETSSTTVEATLNFTPQNTYTVDYTSADGTAIAPNDYTAISSAMLTFNPGNQTTSFPLTIINDSDIENDEDLTIILSNPSSGLTVGSKSTYTFTINDEDNARKIYFSASASTENESTTSIDLTVSLNNIDLTNATSVAYSVIGGTATGSGVDYTLADGTITIPANSADNTFNISVVNDAIYEEDETIIIKLSSPINANLSTIEPIEYTLTIEDDELEPEIQFTTTSSSASEDIGSVDFEVQLSATSEVEASASYTISGTASGNGTDFTLSDGVVEIPAGSTSVDITAVIVDDNLIENTETIIVTLSSPVDCSLGTNTEFTFSITNNDSFGFTGPAGVGDASNNKLWLKADDGVFNDAGVTAAENLDEVIQWNDFSGNANNALSSGNNPNYVTNALNGLPAINFGGNDYIDPSSLGVTGTDGYTYHVVVNVASYDAGGIGDGEGDYIIDRTSGTNELVSLKVASTNKFGFQKRFGDGSSLGGITSTSSVNTSSYQIITYAREVGGDFELYVNGNLEGNTASSNTIITPPTPRIGRHATDDNKGLNGSIAEVIMYGSYLNEAQRIIVENYLAAKYGLTISLFSERYNHDVSHGFDVTGIGQETSSDIHLDSEGGNIRMYNASNLDDGDYLLWGHDNGDLNTESATGALLGLVSSKFTRDWTVTETNEVGTVTVRVDLSGFSGTIEDADLRLLINDDENYDGATVVSGAPSVVGTKVYEWSGISFDDNDHFTVGSISVIDPVDLPIELVYFTARLNDNNEVELEWQTASEENNDFFTIERSSDLRNWEEIQNINGAGNSSVALTYTTKDTSPLAGNAYYRLKQTDFDGFFSYSEIKRINRETALDLVIYPNPTQNRTTILGSKAELSKINIFNALGQNVTHQVFSTSISETELELDFSSLRNGFYVIKTTGSAKKVYKK